MDIQRSTAKHTDSCSFILKGCDPILATGMTVHIFDILVRVHRYSAADRIQKSTTHDLIGRVRRQLEVEKASVRTRESAVGVLVRTRLNEQASMRARHFLVVCR